jgi:hypothetical protein
MIAPEPAHRRGMKLIKTLKSQLTCSGKRKVRYIFNYEIEYLRHIFNISVKVRNQKKKSLISVHRINKDTLALTILPSKYLSRLQMIRTRQTLKIIIKSNFKQRISRLYLKEKIISMISG